MAAHFVEQTIESRAHRPQLATHLGRGAGRTRTRAVARCHRLERGGALALEAALLDLQLVDVGPDGDDVERHDLQLVAQPGGLGLEVGHEVGVEQLPSITFERAAPFRQHGGEPAGPLPQLFHPRQPIPGVALPACRQLGLDRHHRRVEAGERRLQLALGSGALEARRRQRLELHAPRRDLAPGDERLQRVEFGDQRPVPFGGRRLPFERAQLAPHLAQQVLHTEQVRLGGIEPALGLLLAPAELEHASRFLDDRPALLGAGVQHGIDLALADDHVLLAADAGIGQQFLHVEQTARHAVDRVLRIAVAEEDARDRDLGEIDTERAVGVVDRDAHLGTAERGPLGGAGEDHIVHLLAADRLGRLRTEHPGHGIDDIRLARAVRADDHGDPRLQDQGGAVGEGLEALEVETLQEHSSRRTYSRDPPGHPDLAGDLSAGTPDRSGSSDRPTPSGGSIPGHM